MVGLYARGMTAPRWPLCVLILSATFVTAAPSSAAPAPVDGPTVDWVQTSDDSVMDSDSVAAVQAADAAKAADQAVGGETGPDGLFQSVTLDDGFHVFSLRSYGDYTIRLVDSPGFDIETYRPKVQNMANEINAHNGISMKVAASTLPALANPSQPNVPTGEIWVIMTTSSPCGSLTGNALGCGGVRGSSVVEGEVRFSAGAVWLNPTMLPNCRQPVVSHEIGHALGLNHFDELYLGQKQLMASTTDCNSPTSLQAGDLNGVRWLAEPTPSNDSVANAAVVCSSDSTVSASTWFATKESGEATHAGVVARRSVWYRYVPRPEQNGGMATISTSSDGIDDFDTVLEVYSGPTPSISVTSNNGPGLVSQVSFTIQSALTYWVVVDGAGGVGAGRGETDVTFDLPTPAPTTSLVPLCAPARVLDTRFPSGSTVDGQHQAVGAVIANATYQLPIAGRAGVPSDAASVVLNVTAVGPLGNGYVTVFPCGQSLPNASNLNFSAGDVIPNSVLAKIGTAGRVCLFTSTTTNLLVDVSGYFPGTDALVSLPAPDRLLDTRVGGVTVDGAHAGVGPVGADGTYVLPVTNRAGVPLGAATVVLNVTAVQPGVGGYLTVFPCGSIPNASNLNFVAGDISPNLVLARVSGGGTVCFFSSAQTDLLVDVSGYFAAADALVPLNEPRRVLDTRFPTGTTVDGQHQAVGRILAGGTYELSIAGRAGVPANAASVVLNVTAVSPSASGFLTVYACGNAQPNTSNLNFSAGEVIPNSVLARVGGGGRVCFFSSADTDLLVDVSGYFP